MMKQTWIAEDPLSTFRMEADVEVDEDEETSEEETSEEPEDDDDDEELGEPGKKALQRERAARREAERELKRIQTANEGEEEKKVREATEALEQKYHGIIARGSFRAALAEAGLRKGQGKLMKLLDLDEVTVDDEGEVEGVASQVDSLKKEFPELFGRQSKGAGKGDGGQSGTPANEGKPKTSAERLAQQAGF